MTKGRIKYKGRSDKLPVVTLGIIAVNLLVFALICRDPRYYFGIYGLKAFHFRVGRLLTSTFFHDGIMHLSMNMAFLYVFGRQVERVMGRLEYLMFYIGACFAGSLLHTIIVAAALPAYYSEAPVIGASGAIAGVMGLYVVRFHRRVFRLGGAEVPVMYVIALWLLAQLGLGILGLYRDQFMGLELKLVSCWSHLGGFAFGLIVALIANMALQGEREYLIAKAGSNCDEGNLLEAIRCYESLTDHDPDNAFACSEIGRLWAVLDEEEQSLPNYQRAIELYIRQGREEQALGVIRDMKRFWPDTGIDAALRFRLASYLEETGHFNRALEALREIADDAPDSVEAQMSLVKISQIQLVSLGDSLAATGTLCEFVSRYPDSEWRQFAEETMAKAATLSP